MRTVAERLAIASAGAGRSPDEAMPVQVSRRELLQLPSVSPDQADAALREPVGIQHSHYEEERRAQDMTTIREALGTEVDAAARAAGRALSLETAVREALALAGAILTQAKV
jgi:hypothetical protein